MPYSHLSQMILHVDVTCHVIFDITWTLIVTSSMPCQQPISDFHVVGKKQK